jgi:large subunit ribosomal protein L5
MEPFKVHYQTVVLPKVQSELKITNIMSLPKLVKVVINVGVGEAVVNKHVVEKVQEQISLIAGQKAVPRLAKKSIASFKLRKGLAIGVKVTLRSENMYLFLAKLINVVIPRIKDFKGINDRAIDSSGNLNLGFTEQTIFPEIDFESIDKYRGLQVTLVVKNSSKEKGKKFFEILGIPFSKNI